MKTTLHSSRRGLIARRSALVLAVAAAGYVTGLMVNGPRSLGEASAFTQSARAAEPNHNAPLRARQTVAPTTPSPAPAVDSVQSDGPRIQDPRECDVAKGIETACMFMD